VLGALAALWLSGRRPAPAHWPDDGVRQVLGAAARQPWNMRIAARYPQGRGVMK
jgi:hypothetical protein